MGNDPTCVARSRSEDWICNYPLQTKLREGNVSTGICLFGGVGAGGPMTITHDELNLTVPTPNTQTWDLGTFPPLCPPDTRPGYLSFHLLLTCGGRHWRPAQTCSL